MTSSNVHKWKVKSITLFQKSMFYSTDHKKIHPKYLDNRSTLKQITIHLNQNKLGIRFS